MFIPQQTHIPWGYLFLRGMSDSYKSDRKIKSDLVKNIPNIEEVTKIEKMLVVLTHYCQISCNSAISTGPVKNQFAQKFNNDRFDFIVRIRPLQKIWQESVTTTSIFKPLNIRWTYSGGKIHLFYCIIKVKFSGDLLTDYFTSIIWNIFSAEPEIIIDPVPTHPPIISFTMKGPALWIDENGVQHEG